MNFYDFYDKINGKMYVDRRTPPPVHYDLDDYLAQITSEPDNVSGIDGKETAHVDTWKRITMDDMAQASDKDVNDFIKKRGNTSCLGEPLDDEGMRRFTGMGW